MADVEVRHVDRERGIVTIRAMTTLLRFTLCGGKLQEYGKRGSLKTVLDRKSLWVPDDIYAQACARAGAVLKDIQWKGHPQQTLLPLS